MRTAARVVASVPCLLVLLAGAAYAQAPGEVDRAIDRGFDRLDAGDLDGAERIFQRVIQIEPNEAAGHYGLALVQEERGDIEGAAASYRRAAALDPGDPEIQASLGFVLLDLDQAEEACRALARARELDPSDTDVALGYGQALVDVGRSQDALRVLEPLAGAAGDDPYYLYDVGRARRAVGRPAEALVSLGRATLLAPDDDEIASAWADLAREAGTPCDRAVAEAIEASIREDYAAALAAARRAIEADPRDPRGHMQAGIALLGVEPPQPQEAEAALARAIEAGAALPTASRLPGPSVGLAHREMVVARVLRGDDAAALESATAALAADPGNPVALYLRASVEAALGRRADALRDLGQAIEADPELAEDARSDDSFAAYRRDADFRRLVGGR